MEHVDVIIEFILENATPKVLQQVLERYMSLLSGNGIRSLPLHILTGDPHKFGLLFDVTEPGCPYMEFILQFCATQTDRVSLQMMLPKCTTDMMTSACLNVIELAGFERNDGYLGILEDLIVAGADINGFESKVNTICIPTLQAVKLATVVAPLLTGDAPMIFVDLADFISNVPYDAIKFLFESQLPGVDCNPTAWLWGLTHRPTIKALDPDTPPLIRFLYSHGADVNTATGEGVLPIFKFILYDDHPSTKVLLELGAETEAILRVFVLWVDRQDEDFGVHERMIKQRGGGKLIWGFNMLAGSEKWGNQTVKERIDELRRSLFQVVKFEGSV